jgi:2,5-diketo-D-gluconate reductase B
MTSPYFTKTRQRGFGTFPLAGEELARATEAAAEVGYRAFDTAQIYGNEADVGRALARLGLPRSELFVTTKVQHDNLPADRFLPSVERSLSDLGVDRVDVLLLHFPPLAEPFEPGLELLIEAKARGLTDHIGISNYTPEMMRRARKAAGDATLAANQVEFHPLLDGSALLAAAAETGIPLAAYCTVARGEVFKHPLLAAIGAGHGKSAAQVALRWTLQQGVAINTMSTSPANIRANFDIMDFVLSSPEMAQIDALNRTRHRVITREGGVPWAPNWG